MYEELIQALRFCAEMANGWNCPDCPGFDSLCSTGKQIRITAADALEAQSAQFDAKNAEIERMTERAIQWGKKLIEFGEGGARAVTCPECGFPVADYGVNADIYCSWCKAKSSSPNYVAAGPGYCTTSADRKSKTYDRLFHTGRTPAKQDEEG